ncbi:MAG: hypothetical protein IKN14_00765 [Clostridiales bacterium]|nr:hypothetical protein [Clostridiales bacterium]
MGIGSWILVAAGAYFIIKWAVKEGICEAYEAITGKETEETRYVRELMEKDSEKRQKALNGEA